MKPMIFIDLTDILLTGTLVFLVLVILFNWSIIHTRRKYCQHKYHHQEEWSAVCNHCGKNLGYIGTLDRRKMK